MTRFFRRLRARFRYRHFNAELKDELNVHRAMAEDELRASGEAPEDAQRQAARQLGNVTLARESSRGVWLAPWLECVADLFRDLKGAIRFIRRKPTTAIAAVLTLALGVGANVAAFSAVRAVLLDAPPYAAGNRLVVLTPTNIYHQSPFVLGDLEPLSQLSAFSHMAGCAVIRRAIFGASPLISMTAVTEHFFSVFRAAPIAGRVLTSDDYSSGARNVVISHRVWQTYLGGAPDAIGQSLSVNGNTWLIVGIMGEGFSPPCISAATDPMSVWASASSLTAELADSDRGLPLFGVLQTEDGLLQAQAQIDALTQTLAAETRDDRYIGTVVWPLREALTANTGPGLLLMQSITGLLLILTAANLCNLFLTQATERQTEFATRATVGASRLRLVRQVLTEASLVAAIGATLGVFVAWLASSWLTDLAAAVLPRGIVIRTTPTDLALGLFIGWLTVAVFSLVPAILATRRTLVASFRTTGHTTAGPTIRRLRDGLIAAQVLVAVVLLIGAGVLLRGFTNVLTRPVGFDPAGLMTAQLRLEESPSTSGQSALLVERLQEELRRLPGVRGISFSSTPPFHPGGAVYSRLWSFQTPRADATDIPVSDNIKYVSADYLRTLGVPLLRGRFPEAGEPRDGMATVVVNEAFASKYAPDGNILGAHISSDTVRYTVVGVVGNTRALGMTAPFWPIFYAPMPDDHWDIVSVVARVTDRSTAARSLQNAIESTAPGALSSAVESVETTVWRGERRRRFYVLLTSFFASLSVLLAAVGIYGVMNRATMLRRPELALRSTLGARPSSLVLMVIANGLRPALLGLFGGLLGAWWLAGLVKSNSAFGSLLFEVDARDALAFSVLPIGLLVVAFVACLLPALRAARVEPAIVVRGVD